MRERERYPEKLIDIPSIELSITDTHSSSSTERCKTWRCCEYYTQRKDVQSHRTVRCSKEKSLRRCETSRKFSCRVPTSNTVNDGLRKNWSYPDPLGTPYTEAEVVERRSETKRNLSDCSVKLRRSEKGVLVSLRKSSSKWTVCRDLAIVSSHKTSDSSVETKRSKRSSSTISEDDLKPVPNDLKSSSPIRHKRNISGPVFWSPWTRTRRTRTRNLQRRRMKM